MTQVIDNICKNFEAFMEASERYFSGAYDVTNGVNNPIAQFRSQPLGDISRFRYWANKIDLSNHRALTVDRSKTDLEAAADAFVSSLMAVPILACDKIQVAMDFSYDKKRKSLRKVRLTIETIDISTDYLIFENASKRLRSYLEIINAAKEEPRLKSYNVDDHVICAFSSDTALLKVFAGYAAQNNVQSLNEGVLQNLPHTPHAVVCIDEWSDTAARVLAIPQNPKSQ